MTGETPDRRYRRLLLVLLVPAAFFNGFDGELRVVLLPQLQQSFHVGIAAIGLANIPIASGQFIAFLLVRRADRIGRRPILLVTMFGYALFTGLSALSWNLVSFAAFQTLSQVFIGTESALAVLVVAEEFPAERRGRAIGLLLVAAPLGVVGTAALLGAGLLHAGLGWRSFYLVGLLPVLLVGLARGRLRETSVYTSGPRVREPLARAVLAAPWRNRILALGAISLLQKIPAAAGAGWWVYYAEHERHLSTGLVALDLGTAFALGTSGYYCCGRLIDRFGRRPVACCFLLIGSASGVALFQSSGEVANFLLLIVAVFFGLGIGPALSALSAESFPTSMRAGASAIVGNGFANVGELAGPALVGVLGAAGGLIGNVGDAVCVLAPLMVLAIPILLVCVPETVGRSLVDLTTGAR